MINIGHIPAKDMRKSPSSIEKKIICGKHIARQQLELWNSNWSNILIDRTFMKHGKGLRVLIGITLQQRSVRKWAYSLHVSTQILKDLEKMRSFIQIEVPVNKEEKPGRGKLDKVDREKLCPKLDICFFIYIFAHLNKKTQSPGM